jgi:hypothetical protein
MLRYHGRPCKSNYFSFHNTISVKEAVQQIYLNSFNNNEKSENKNIKATFELRRHAVLKK